MAEIPIQRKESRNWLPLLLLGLLLLAILGYCFLRPRAAPVVTTGDSTRATTVAADTTATAAPVAAAAGSSAVDQYMQFVQQRDTSMETEAQHRYTAEGVRRLAAALDQVASAGAGTGAGQAAGQAAAAGGSAAIQVYADSMRSSIDRLQASSPNDVHAEDARAAFNAAVSAMTVIAKAEGRTYDVAPMRAITKQLVRTTPLMPQLPIVERFFTTAGQALQALNIPGAAGTSTGGTSSSSTGTGMGTSGTGTSGTGTSGTGH